MTMRFNPPPNWPRPAEGWSPPPGWRPDPAWGPVPHGWQLWVIDPHSSHRSVPVMAQTTTQLSSSRGTAMIAVAAASCGLAAFIPPLWAARQRPRDLVFRRRMHTLAGCLFGLMVVGLILTAAAGEDATGSPTGFLADVGATLLVINLLVGVTAAVLLRNTQPTGELPGAGEELARRRLRDQYRQLATGDPSLARTIGVGRPDLSRNLDDGGLLDLNAIPGARLGELAGITAAEADRLADARQSLGRFTSIEEVAVYADLSDSTVATLRERAIFIAG